MRILVTGGSGFIGRSLCSRLLTEGHSVSVLTRKPAHTAGLFGSRITTIGYPLRSSLPGHFDAIVNLAGAPIFGRRWSAARKQLLFDSRVTFTKQIVDWIAQMDPRPSVLLSGSAIGYYGDQGEDTLEETSPPSKDGFSHELCSAWEGAAVSAEHMGVRVCTLRTGIVLGPSGGLLQRMSVPFRLGLGGRLGTGRQWMSWIHLQDHIAALLALLNDPKAAGPYNLTAPEPVTNRFFTESLGRHLHRPAFLHLPAPLLKWLLGEMSELLLGSQKVIPRRLIREEAFGFQFPTLDAALADCLKRHHY